ncbi:predicted protein [Pyrenophora tritici-repentis Pt-1C-BFP]|nr:uncharacterized protein PTRG_10317 [Pyrenophora tritici-repentis Pt-1C-BFP]EDU43368.1 predicted protein [Pyrenophora tritici-repentis Pt-1C-BFP]
MAAIFAKFKKDAAAQVLSAAETEKARTNSKAEVELKIKAQPEELFASVDAIFDMGLDDETLILAQKRFLKEGAAAKADFKKKRDEKRGCLGKSASGSDPEHDNENDGVRGEIEHETELEEIKAHAHEARLGQQAISLGVNATGHSFPGAVLTSSGEVEYKGYTYRDIASFQMAYREYCERKLSDYISRFGTTVMGLLASGAAEDMIDT